MAGLVPAIHFFLRLTTKARDTWREDGLSRFRAGMTMTERTGG
jgi:hypothetical protein